GLPAQQMRARKQEEFGRLKFEYQQLKRSWGGYSSYDHWFDRALNNAHLVSAATYYGCVPGLQRLLESLGGDLPKFYEAAKKLAEQDSAQRRRLCENASGGDPSTT